MSELERIAETFVRCGKITCQAAPGFPCITTSGAVARYVHRHRTRAVTEAWRLGYYEGGMMALDQIERRCDPDKADLDPRATLADALRQVRRWI